MQPYRAAGIKMQQRSRAAQQQSELHRLLKLQRVNGCSESCGRASGCSDPAAEVQILRQLRCSSDAVAAEVLRQQQCSGSSGAAGLVRQQRECGGRRENPVAEASAAAGPAAATVPQASRGPPPTDVHRGPETAQSSRGLEAAQRSTRFQ